MSILPAGDNLPLSTRLSIVYDVAREISLHTEPQAMLEAYRKRVKAMMPFDRTIAISARGVAAPAYRITRSDLWDAELNPWKDADKLPVHSAGLLSRLLWEGRAVLLNEFSPESTDPAYEHFEGMHSMVAIPHFDQGEPVNMVIHLCRQPHAFDVDALPEFMLISSLFGRAIKALAMSNEVMKTEAKLRLQNETLQQLSDTIMNQALELKHHAERLDVRIRERTAELQEAHLESIFMLAAACEAKDADTGSHVRRIWRWSEQIAKEMGLADAEAIGYSAILHDVGKMHVPDEILQKPASLTDAERVVMQGHTLAGDRILGESSYFTTARVIARSHHENFDGTGYPDRLGGDDIPLEARIVRVADFYDAVTSRRVYKPAWPIERALDSIRSSTGTLFDPGVVRAFLAAHAGACRDLALLR